MIQLPKGIDRRDAEQWLSHGYAYVDSPKHGMVVGRYLGIADDEAHFEAYLNGDTNNAVRLVSKYTKVFCHWPLCGSVNLKSHKLAINVGRKAGRMYRRTYNNNALTLDVPGKWSIIQTLGTGAVPKLLATSPEVALACFNPEYPSLDEALHWLEAGEWASVAVSPHLILMGNKSKKIYHRGTLAAIVEDGYLSSLRADTDANRVNKLLGGRFLT